MSEKNIWGKLRRLVNSDQRRKAIVIPRRYHKLTRKAISPNALKVLYRLKAAGFSGYLVGGGVRDVLLGLRPKDFDVATNALPEQVRSLFRNSRLIGRRFRLAHVYFSNEIVEVSTFRANTEEQTKQKELEDVVIIQPDNTYGTIEEDAWRRDFTVNAIYYNIQDYSIIDYTGGMWDLRRRLIRMIGDPNQRFHEDPVRLLRAIRLAAKLEFNLHRDTDKQVRRLFHLLQHVPRSRLFDEVLKLFFEGNAEKTYVVLKRYQYMKVLFPSLMNVLQNEKQPHYQRLVDFALAATDERFQQGKSLNPGFLFSVFLWPALQTELGQQEKGAKQPNMSLHAAIDNVLMSQLKILNIPRRLTGMMRSIWVLQYHLQRRRLNRLDHVLQHRYFRAAIDFFELRAKLGECDQTLSDWWFIMRDASQSKRQKMIEELRHAS